MQARGYSLIELVVVVALVSMLAAVALPRIAGWGVFGQRAFSDELVALLRHGQKAAIAQRRTVRVEVTAAEVKACYDAACTHPVQDPVRGGRLSLDVPNGVAVSPATLSFSFDALGRPSMGVSLTITGEITRTIVVEPETGYVHG